ncbi:MAG: hypothetical protein ACKOCX_13780 [Planctomycetota bacterium]
MIAAPVVARFVVALPKAIPAAVPVTAMLVALDAQPVIAASGRAASNQRRGRDSNPRSSF